MHNKETKEKIRTIITTFSKGTNMKDGDQKQAL